MKQVAIGSLKILQLVDADRLHIPNSLADEVAVRIGKDEYTLLTQSNKNSYPLPIRRTSDEKVGLGFTLRALTETKKGEVVTLTKPNVQSLGEVGFFRHFDYAIEKVLRSSLGAPISTFRTAMGFPGDDDRALIRIDSSIFARLGISPGDQVFVEYAGKKISAFAFEQLEAVYAPNESLNTAKAVGLNSAKLPKDFPTYLITHISPIARHALGISKDDVTSIVRVQRRVRTKLASELNKLLLPLTVLIVGLVPAPIHPWFKYLIYLFGIPAIILISLAPVRIRKATNGLWP